jgi:hypothetical protein
MFVQREDAYLHFRWTPRNTRIVLLGLVAIPGALYYATTKNDVRL